MTAAKSLPCPSWCTDTKNHTGDNFRADRNCWGPGHEVVLHLEEHGPNPELSIEDQMDQDPPRIDPCAYRPWHSLPLVYLHLYRPHENDRLDLDTNLKLTVAEAIQLATALLDVVEEIGGAR
jgi:hypothetical protein